MKTRWCSILALLALVSACDGGGDGTGGGGSGATGGTGGTTAGGGGTGGGGEGGGGSGGATTSSSTTPTGDCSVAEPCTGAGQSCVFPMDSCDPSAKGVCTSGVSCDPLPNHGPICLCDGTVFQGDAECLVWQQNKPIADPEVCATETFGCGNQTCKKNVQFCLTTGKIGDFPTYECKDISSVKSTCIYGIADCGCIDLIDLGCADASCCGDDGFFQETVSLITP